LRSLERFPGREGVKQQVTAPGKRASTASRPRCVAGITCCGIRGADSGGRQVGSIWQLRRADKPMIVPLSESAKPGARLDRRFWSGSANLVRQSSRTYFGDDLADALRTKR
jgi:hypothetical protein